MQVDTIKPSLKPPGTKRLKLKWRILLSTSAFKMELRRFNEAYALDVLSALEAVMPTPAAITGAQAQRLKRRAIARMKVRPARNCSKHQAGGV